MQETESTRCLGSLPSTDEQQRLQVAFGLTSMSAQSSDAETDPHPKAGHNATYTPPSVLPSIMDDRVAPRTRLSLVLSSLTINLLLPFINGVMLGFGEIFAKDVIVGWFGWKSRHGSIATALGLWR